MARQDPNLALVRANGLVDNPTYKIDIDREKASALGVNLERRRPDVLDRVGLASTSTTSSTPTAASSASIVQADAPFRMNPEDLNKLFVRNSAGTMVPFTSFATGHWTWGSPKLERYNGVSSFEIQGQAAPGQSTGQAMAEMERLLQKLPAGVGYEWTGTSLQEQPVGVAGAAICTRCRSSSFSCASRRCTRAGRCRSR